MISKYLNFITLVPDNIPITINTLSEIGWYVLYAPDSNQRQSETATPIPIYHDGTNRYEDWTTIIPIGCHGHANFQVGKCQLVYQNLEDNLTSQTKTNSYSHPSTGEKSLVSVLGRILYPKFPEIPINDNYEYYCFYAKLSYCLKFNSKKIPLINPELLSNWKIGFITYADIPSSAIVPTTIFGVPIEATYRNIGSIKTYLETSGSYSLKSNIYTQIPLIETSNTPPELVKIIDNFPLVTITNPPSKLRILTGSATFGLLLISDSNILVKYLNNDIIELSNCNGDFTIDFSNLIWTNPLFTFDISAGNVVLTVIIPS